MKRLLLVAVLATAACSPDTAQQAHPRVVSSSPPAPVLAPQDRDFLERAAQGSNAEIAMGGLAVHRATRPDIQAYGRMMIADHTALNQRLAAIARRYDIALPTSLGENQAGYDRLIDVQREQFDQEFMQVMNEDHDMAYMLFKGEADGGHDPALRAFAASSLPIIERHLLHAKSMARGINPTP